MRISTVPFNLVEENTHLLQLLVPPNSLIVAKQIALNCVQYINRLSQVLISDSSGFTHHRGLIKCALAHVASESFPRRWLSGAICTRAELYALGAELYALLKLKVT